MMPITRPDAPAQPAQARARMRRLPTALALSALAVVSALGFSTPVGAQSASNRLSEHVRKDIERHRAMAAAHEAAAKCLESGKAEDQCVKELQVACKGLGIGKYCGMRHEH